MIQVLMKGAVLIVVVLTQLIEASVISKSSKEECVVENDVKTIDNVTCTTKLVVSLTVNANEVANFAQQYLWC